MKSFVTAIVCFLLADKATAQNAGRKTITKNSDSITEIPFSLEGHLTVSIGSVLLKDPRVKLITADFPAVNIGFLIFNKYLVGTDYTNKLMQIQERR